MEEFHPVEWNVLVNRARRAGRAAGGNRLQLRRTVDGLELAYREIWPGGHARG